MVATATVLAVVAVVVGTIWLSVGLYTYAPVYRKALMRLLGRARSPRIYDVGTDTPAGDLPTIDVLVPAYDERETLEHSLRGLRAADYPADKLRLTVLVEPEDAVTRRELARLQRRYDARELVVPPSYPGDHNKPRALNYGFEHTDAEVVGVVDADNVVDPDLLGMVVHAIEDGHDYVQAPIDAANESDGLLNTLFRGEYGFWYRTVIPSFFRVGYPVPLGGTSNFVRRSVLDAVADERVERFGAPWSAVDSEALAAGGWRGAAPWDPRNVTEDFELGLLLWELGYSMAMVDATTHEESPVGINAWLRQRTRWQKGKLYTLIQRLRVPPADGRTRLHVYAQSALPHLGPVNLLGVLVIAIYATLVGFLAAPFVAAILLIGLALAVQQLVVHAAGYWTATDTRGLRRVWRTVLTVVFVPGYWALQWGADVRAIVQLVSGETTWEKTTHTGSHVTDTTLPADHDPDTIRAVVTETDAGWVWMLERGRQVLARSSQPIETQAAAVTAVLDVRDLVVQARGASDARFDVDGDDKGWQWSLSDRGAPIASGPDPTESGRATIDHLVAVRTAVDTASVPPSAAADRTEVEVDTDMTALTR